MQNIWPFHDDFFFKELRHSETLSEQTGLLQNKLLPLSKHVHYDYG